MAAFTPPLGETDGAISVPEPPQTATLRGGETKAVAQWLGDAPALTVLGLIGVVAYAFLRLAYVFFYRQFGMVPEDVGFGYFEILSQSLPGLLVFMALVLVLSTLFLGCLVTTVGLMIGTGDSATEMYQLITQSRVGRAILVAVVIFLAGLAVAVRWEVAQVMLGFIAYGAVCAGLTWMVKKRFRNSIDFVWAWGPRVLLGIVLLVTIAGAPFVYVKQAESDGAAVYRGEVRHPTLMGWVPLANWGGDPAHILWQRDTVPDAWAERANNCLMYLGRTAEANVLFDVTTQEVVRVPSRAATVVVTTRDDLTCAPASAP